ncbi:uncharacterized protein LOC127809265 [Diospyros lotus]|uniref:uncharacterized protein LOC127809265 n=1 Tax=Diospyros lotus TaxID=55363 RepID=UPI002254EE54|nr:uncharacterized protein LOC127809265 [Diospyros lotus]
METVDSRSTPNSEEQSLDQYTPSQGATIRQKKDIAWRYVTEAKNSEGKKAKEKKSGPQFDDDDEIEEIQHFTTKDGKSGSFASSKGKRKIGEMTSFFKYGVQDSKQPSIKACVQSKERWHDTDMAIALWFYDACIPTNAVNSPFFQKAVDKIASMGHGYKAPNYHALHVNLLRDAKTQIKLIIDSFRSHWAEVGCTIMGDGWTDTRQRPLINFLVYCSKGLSFIKSVNASNFIMNVETLCNLFAEIVEFVGPNNMVHMVTNNGVNYKAARRKLSERYPTIRWSPCAAHCINLIMKDMSEMNDVENVATLASKVTIFIYNHKWTLNWLRMRPGWKEIVRPGATHFATTFIALKSLHDHKDHLQALVLNLCQNNDTFDMPFAHL